MDASGWCPGPAAQCPDPEAVKLLVLPHTMGANLYRVLDGTLRKGVSEEGFKEVVGEAFAAVRFPSMPCHLWRVAKVRGEGAFKSPLRGFKWLNRASPFKFSSWRCV